jgi:hypothetical protein
MAMTAFNVTVERQAAIRRSAFVNEPLSPRTEC